MKQFNPPHPGIILLEDWIKPLNFTISEFDKYKEILRKYIEPVFSSLTVKDGCVDTIKKLKEDGNTIYIITARSNRYSDNIYDLTVDYLNKNGIIYGAIFDENFNEEF